jgi:hypothetical protein
VSDGASFAVTTNGGKEREPSVTTGSGSNWGVVYGQDTEGTSQQSVLLRVVAPK